MSYKCFLCSLVLLTIYPESTNGEILTHPVQIFQLNSGVNETENTSEAGEMLVTTPTPQPVPGEGLAYVELRFEQSLPLGTVLHLWPATESASPDTTYEMGFWITGVQTGNVIRFDVTDIARDWLAGALANNGLIVRTVPDDSESEATEGASVLNSAYNALLLYHTYPLVDRPIPVRGKRKDGKLPVKGE